MTDKTLINADELFDDGGTDGEIGAIDRNGNVVIPFEFEYLSTMSTGLISAYNAEDGWRVFAKMAKTK